MKQPEKTATEAKAESDGGLRLKNKRSVVETQFFKRVAKVAVL